MRPPAVLYRLLLLLLILPSVVHADSPVPRMNKTEAWLYDQLLPNLVTINSSRANRLGFEWEVAPLLYSFGISKLASPWHSFFVTPTERFSGSIELIGRGLVLTRYLDGALLGGSVELLGHIPLVERGEHFGLNLGASEYWYGTTKSLFIVGGVYTLFGLVHGNVRYSFQDHVWMGALEFRLF